VNIGAGTITCNFDGRDKHRTDIGDGAFIGSDTMLVAPVRVGAGSRTGAGSVVTHDVPDGMLAVGVPARLRHPAGPPDRRPRGAPEAGGARPITGTGAGGDTDAEPAPEDLTSPA